MELFFWTGPTFNIRSYVLEVLLILYKIVQ